MLRFTVAAIYTEFETQIYDDSQFINEDRFVTGKAGERLDLVFKRVPSTASYLWHWTLSENKRKLSHGDEKAEGEKLA